VQQLKAMKEIDLKACQGREEAVQVGVGEDVKDY
jgi:hypothetical protein